MGFNPTKTTLILNAVFMLSLFTISNVQARPGDLDTTFGSGGMVMFPYAGNNFFGANAVAVQSDGKIVTAGSGSDGTFFNRGFGITRYSTDGTPDTTFGSGGRVITNLGGGVYDAAWAVAIQSDGKIIAAGSSNVYGEGNRDFLLARYNTDGSLDQTFGSGGKVVTTLGDAFAHDMAIQSDGRIVVAGDSGSQYTSGDFLLVRYNTNGSLDTSFGTGGIVANTFGSSSIANAVAIQSEGKIVAAGISSNAFALARYNTNGSLDLTFGSGGKVITTFSTGGSIANAAAIQSDGKIVAAGHGSDGTNSGFALARYSTNGSLDSTFGSGGKVITTFSTGGSNANAAAIQSDGKIVAAGYGSDGTNVGFALTRYNTNGSLDSTFGSGGKVVTHISDNNDYANAAAIQSDNKIVVTGRLYPLAGSYRFALVRYQSASFTVTRSDDRNNATCVPGDCSLREAVSAANTSATEDTIDFAAGLRTITLTNEIVINNAGALTINGPGANVLTIDGGAGTNRIFYTDRATVTIFSMTMTGGNGGNGDGGAIQAIEGSLTLDGVYVTGNTAPGHFGGDYPSGGGGVSYIGGTHRIINSTFFANTGNCGGGILNLGALTIVNSTISGNTAGGGGGICIYFGATTLRNVTITNNTAFGGGLYSGGGGILNSADYPFSAPLNFGNTIVAGNTSTNGIAPEISFIHGSITSAGGNLVGDSPGDSTNTGRAIAYQPTDVRDTDPRLSALADNGGTTPTHALLAGSPIIDKGLNALAVDPSNGNGLAFDQRGAGFARIRDGNGDNIATVDIGAFEIQPVNVANIEELYSAVNDPQNAGMHIIIAPGIYMLSVNDPGGAARPNGGRIELQENMSLQGVVGDRGKVVIDAMSLPESSYSAPPVPRTAAIRMGRGTNAIEWLTARNAEVGNANIGTDLASAATNIRIAHVASTNSQRGIDVRNFGTAMAGRVIEAEIVDNDLFNNTRNIVGEGLRIVNNGGATGAFINAALRGNRSHDNFLGLIVEDNGSSLANITVSSTGDRFFENGLGVLIGGGLSGSNFADGNSVNFMALGSSFENNNGFNNYDHGGLLVIGGENTSFPNGTSDNTVNVELRHCRLGNNQKHDLAAFGARSNPVSIGSPGRNNHVTVNLNGTQVPVLVFADTIPKYPEKMNSVTITRTTTPFDFDGDGRADISVFRPSDGNWYLDRSQAGFYAAQFGLSSDKIVPADYDGDGKKDIAVYRPSEGTWYVSNSSNGTFASYAFGLANDIPTPDDYDGDGRADLSVFRPSDGTWYRSDSSDGQFRAFQFGQNGDVPLIGDYDADGKTDLTVFRPSTGYWYVRRSSDNGVWFDNFGLDGDIPLNGDFDGDESADLAVYRPVDGKWYIARPGGVPSQDFDAIPFGLPTDLPVPADYDGDGKTDVAVFRPSNGYWYIANSSNGTFTSYQWGQKDDTPTPTAFRY